MNEQQTGLSTESVTISNKQKEVVYENSKETVTPVELELDESEHVARVRISGGTTKKLEQFEFLRIDVALELPCKAKKKNIQEVYEYAKQWVGDKIDEITEEATASHYS